MTSETKNCQNCKNDFSIEPDDFSFYEKIQVPPPTFCPECRYQRRLTNRNEWIFYKRDCDLCGVSVVSIHNPEYTGIVYCQPCFWSDNWDPIDFGFEFDFSRPFFEQFKELRWKTPRIALANSQSVNSEYTNQSERNRDCYLCVSSGENENCLYSYWAQKNKDCMDCYMIEGCELLYECINCKNCNRGAYLEDCNDCSNGYFLKDCKGCTDCFACYGLRGKSYCWLNEQLSKEEYKKRFSEFVWDRKNILSSLASLEQIELRYPHKYYRGRSNVQPEGDYLQETKNTKSSYNCSHTENLKYCQDAWWSKDSYDCTEVYSELGYENEGCIATRCLFVAKTWDVFDSIYVDLCYNSNNLFGCVSLRKKNYCILNKQYLKEEYEILSQKIIEHMKRTGEWGEFFPHSISPFSYNETVAQDYFPLSKNEALEKGFEWFERNDRNYAIDINAGTLPETIQEVDDTVVKKNILCKTQSSTDLKGKYQNCANAFTITTAELILYRKMGLPLPQQCFQCRRQDRMEKRNPRELHHRQCMCDKDDHEHQGACPVEFETSYAPERPEIVYCESCYQKEVV